MKKTTKGAIAAVGAAALLLGGAGTLAYWNATATVGGGAITAGELKLTDTTAGGGCATAGWTLDGGGTYTPGTSLVVPGDVLTKTCQFQIVATGDHLAAAATVTTPAGTGALPTSVVGAFTVDGSALAGNVTSAQDGKILEAKITVTVDQTVSLDNASQGKASTIGDYTVTLTQAHS